MFTVCSACLNGRNVSYKRTSEGSNKWTHNIQQMPCRWGNGHNRAPVLLHPLRYYGVDTHTGNCASSCWHTQAHRWPYWSSHRLGTLRYQQHTAFSSPSTARKNDIIPQRCADIMALNAFSGHSMALLLTDIEMLQLQKTKSFDLCILFSNLSGS